MKFNLHVWRQKNAQDAGRMETYSLDGVRDDCSFLEMMDQLNAKLLSEGKEPVAFDHDCREGICGMCSLVINGIAHGPEQGVTTCQTYMRSFQDGQEIYIEPWRAKPFPVIRDLVVDRSAFDRIQQAGGFVSCATGGAPDGNAVPIGKDVAEVAMDAAACIGCGACVAACKNASAMLFVASKVAHLALLPQGQPERTRRVLAMVEAMDKEGFGNCTNQYECEAVCPAKISRGFMAQMNREFAKASLKPVAASQKP